MKKQVILQFFYYLRFLLEYGILVLLLAGLIQFDLFYNDIFALFDVWLHLNTFFSYFFALSLLNNIILKFHLVF